MEERLIHAVAIHPELYDSSCFLYRDRNKKDLAWRNISEEIGQPEDICRRKWKSLRDTYTKEKKLVKEKRSGSAAGWGRRWKFSAVMGFLDPFLTPRETSSNMGEGGNVQTADQGQPEEAAGESQTEESADSAVEPSPVASPGSPVPGPSAPAAAPTGPQRRRAHRRTRDGSQDGPSEVDLAILESLKRPRQSPTELFLLSLVPALESMPPQTRESVKFQFHKIIFENTTATLKSDKKKWIEQLSVGGKSSKKWRETCHRTKDRKEAQQTLITPPEPPQQLLEVKDEAVEEEVRHLWSSSVKQQDPELLHVKKEEEEELWTGQEIVHLMVKSEDEEKPQLLQLHQIKTEDNRETEPAAQLNS